VCIAPTGVEREGAACARGGLSVRAELPDACCLVDEPGEADEAAAGDGAAGGVTAGGDEAPKVKLAAEGGALTAELAPNVKAGAVAAAGGWAAEGGALTAELAPNVKAGAVAAAGGWAEAEAPN
jgi:hypothetical protein